MSFNHDDAIRIERAIRKTNGSHWDHSADAIEHEPSRQLAIALFERLFGNDEKGRWLYWAIRCAMTDPTDDQLAMEAYRAVWGERA